MSSVPEPRKSYLLPLHHDQTQKPRCHERAKRRGRIEPEIDWRYAPRIQPGDYHAISCSASPYFDKQFKRWVCAVQFEIVSESVLMESVARLTWFLNLGTHAKPHAGRRGKYWAAWVRANGGPPKRGDRLSPRVCVGRMAIVRVEDTTKTHDRGDVESDQAYSVIRDKLLSGKPEAARNEEISRTFLINRSFNQPTKAGIGEVIAAHELAGVHWQNGVRGIQSFGPGRGQG